MKKEIHPVAHAWLMTAGCSCWYCNGPLKETGRFCNKVCAEAFEEDEMAMERRLLVSDRDLVAGHVAGYA